MKKLTSRQVLDIYADLLFATGTLLCSMTYQVDLSQ